MAPANDKAFMLHDLESDGYTATPSADHDDDHVYIHRSSETLMTPKDVQQALRRERDYASASGASTSGKRAAPFPGYRARETRRFRRSKARALFKRALLILPISILVYFGILHVLEVLVGRSHWAWNAYAPSQLRALQQWPGWWASNSQMRPAPEPLPCLSHNDYSRADPLFDAIRWGCTGVEADVWLFNQELFVGHSRGGLDRNRTLTNLYVNPLAELLDKQHSVLDGIPPEDRGLFAARPDKTLVLLVDFKTNPDKTYNAVHRQLQPLRERRALSYWDGQHFHSRAITVVASGRASLDLITSRQPASRDIFLDAPLHALWEPPRHPIESDDPLHEQDGKLSYGEAMSLPEIKDGQQTLTPSTDVQALDPFNISTSYLASTSFRSSVGQVWRGHLSPRQMKIIRGQIKAAKRRGLKVRYWDTPVWPTSLRNHIWHVLVKEGADVLNVDDLEAAALQEWNLPVHDMSLRFR